MQPTPHSLIEEAMGLLRNCSGFHPYTIDPAILKLRDALGLLTHATSHDSEISQPSNCDRAEDQRSNADRERASNGDRQMVIVATRRRPGGHTDLAVFTHNDDVVRWAAGIKGATFTTESVMVNGMLGPRPYSRAEVEAFEANARKDERDRWARALLLAAASSDMSDEWRVYCEAWAVGLYKDSLAPRRTPDTESQCLEMAQATAKIAADFIDQAAALAPSPTHAMLYAAIGSLLRGDLDTHLVRFIQGAKPNDAELRLEELRGFASALVSNPAFDAVDAIGFVRGMAKKEGA